MERAEGIELSSSVWKTEVIPLYDARIVNLLPCFGNKASLVTSRQSLRLYLNPVALPCLSQFLF